MTTLYNPVFLYGVIAGLVSMFVFIVVAYNFHERNN